LVEKLDSGLTLATFSEPFACYWMKFSERKKIMTKFYILQLPH